MTNENGKPKVDAAEHVAHAEVVERADAVQAVNIDTLGGVARRWYWPIFFGSIAAFGGAVMLVGSLIITIQRADKAENAVDKAVAEQVEEQERDACYDRHVALIADSGVISRIALNGVVIILADSVTGDLTQSEINRQLAAGVQDLRAVDLQARGAVAMRKSWIADSQPLPCPLSSTLEPTITEPGG